jgi:quinolinate synthase
VLLPVLDAGCPLADMITSDELIKLKKEHPDAMVVSYVNTSAQIKALSDVCCTSANAIEVVKNVASEKIIFTPDKNLGWWVKKNVPEKELIIWPGYCLVHERFTRKEVEDAKKLHPDAEVIVHPECQSEILEMADFVASTSGMLKRAKQSKAKKFIIGTEAGMIYRLKKENPDKSFYSLGSAKMCVNMKKITIDNLLGSLEKDRYKIELEPDVLAGAKKSLEEMVKYV